MTDKTRRECRVSETSGHKKVCFEFDDNERLSLLCGQHNRHLDRIEQALHVGLSSFGNQITITGDQENVDKASQAFTNLYRQLSDHDTGTELSATLIDDLLRQAEHGVDPGKSPIDKSVFAITWKKKFTLVRLASLLISDCFRRMRSCSALGRQEQAKPIWRSPGLLIV